MKAFFKCIAAGIYSMKCLRLWKLRLATETCPSKEELAASGFFLYF
jgi:hypothetical protein